MKILCIGCSYTNGRVKNQKKVEHTWPYILYNNTNYTVYNLAEAGTNNIFNTRVLEIALEKINPDIVFYQYTLPYRFYFYPSTIDHNIFDYIENIDRYYYLRKDLDGKYFFFGPSFYKYEYPKFFIDNPEKVKKFFYKYFQNDTLRYFEKINQKHTLELLKNYNTIYINWYRDQEFNCNICIEDDVGFHKDNIVDTSNHFSYTGNKKIVDFIEKKYHDILYGTI